MKCFLFMNWDLLSISSRTQFVQRFLIRFLAFVFNWLFNYFFSLYVLIVCLHFQKIFVLLTRICIYLYLLYVCSYCLFTPLKNLNFLHAYIYVCVCICIFWPGREIAPNRGANATKFFTLVTKSWKLVAKLAGELKRFANINPRQTSSFSLFSKRSTCISIDDYTTSWI